MKIKPGYILRQVLDTYIVIGVGSEAYVPNQIMCLNETGACLWNILEKSAERRDLVEGLMKEYEVDAQTAEMDVDAFIEQLREKALISE